MCGLGGMRVHIFFNPLQFKLYIYCIVLVNFKCMQIYLTKFKQFRLIYQNRTIITEVNHYCGVPRSDINFSNFGSREKIFFFHFIPDIKMYA